MESEVAASNLVGALKSPSDSRDWVYEDLARGGDTHVLPETYDLRGHMRPSRDQGSRGTCAAFTACAITEIHSHIEEGINEWMSPEFIYFHRDNKPASGMYGRNVFQIMKKIGSVPEKQFPYQPRDQKLAGPSPPLYICAQKYRIISYARVKTVDGLKLALHELGPAYLLLPLYASRPKFWIDDGTPCVGGHSVTVVGYDKVGFILKNSWGETWNGDGTIIFPYSEWPLQWECWITINDREAVSDTRVAAEDERRTSEVDAREMDDLIEIDLTKLGDYVACGSESDSPPPIDNHGSQTHAKTNPNNNIRPRRSNPNLHSDLTRSDSDPKKESKCCIMM
jgi:hypothetical protein